MFKPFVHVHSSEWIIVMLHLLNCSYAISILNDCGTAQTFFCYQMDWYLWGLSFSL